MKIIFILKGQDVILKARHYGSVGIWSEIKCGDAFEVNHHFRYERVYSSERPSGGDEGETIYYLTPRRIGLYRVQLKNIFRGNVESIEKYLIVVLPHF